MGSIRKELAEQGLIPRKKWGQHFLTDKNILKKVIKTAEIEKEDIVLEVGPGLGEMTQSLAHEARKVIAVEIDPRLVEILRNKLADISNVEIIQSDILKFAINLSQCRIRRQGKMACSRLTVAHQHLAGRIEIKERRTQQ